MLGEMMMEEVEEVVTAIVRIGDGNINIVS